MNAATAPELQSKIPSRKKPTTLLHLTVWSVPRANPHCLAHENQNKATTGPVETVPSEYVQIPEQKQADIICTYNSFQMVFVGPVSVILEVTNTFLRTELLHQGRKCSGVNPSGKVHRLSWKNRKIGKLHLHEESSAQVLLKMSGCLTFHPTCESQPSLTQTGSRLHSTAVTLPKKGNNS